MLIALIERFLWHTYSWWKVWVRIESQAEKFVEHRAALRSTNPSFSIFRMHSSTSIAMHTSFFFSLDFFLSKNSCSKTATYFLSFSPVFIALQKNTRWSQSPNLNPHLVCDITKGGYPEGCNFRLSYYIESLTFLMSWEWTGTSETCWRKLWGFSQTVSLMHSWS